MILLGLELPWKGPGSYNQFTNVTCFIQSWSGFECSQFSNKVVWVIYLATSNIWTQAASPWHGCTGIYVQSQFQKQFLPEQLYVRTFISCKVCHIYSWTGSDIHAPLETKLQTGSRSAGEKKKMLMNETGENVCMRARDASTLFISMYSRKQLALWSHIQYYINCPRICTSVGSGCTTGTAPVLTNMIWISLTNWCDSGYSDILTCNTSTFKTHGSC